MLTYTVNHEEPAQEGTRILLGSPPSVTIAARDADGETLWEFDVEQRDYESRTGLEPAIELNMPPVQSTWVVLSSDAYEAFREMPSFFTWLAQARPQTLDWVRVYLDSSGAIDVTKRG